MRRKMAAGNWKMNGLAADLGEIDELCRRHPDPTVDLLICPPATLLHRMTTHAGPKLKIGAQDCHAAGAGAHTGDLSAQMLIDAGASHVILGHSERRSDHAESDAAVRDKAAAAMAAGLTAIVCLGETKAQRDAGQALDVVRDQLANSLPDGAAPERLIIAYEPVWAIGTGDTPTTAQIAEVHATLRSALAERLGTDAAERTRLLYGGSVKGSNAAEIFAVPDVDGALVGGASLKAEDFSPIISALESAA
jgi:triosephosphate isomerase